MSTPRWRRLLALALLVPALLAVGEGLHHHETLAALLSPAEATSGTARAISGHNPLSAESHWHAVVLLQEDACAACSIHRASAMPTALLAVAPITISFRAHSYAASIRPSFARIALGSRAPPSLL